jgi:hypothetical protein
MAGGADVEALLDAARTQLGGDDAAGVFKTLERARTAAMKQGSLDDLRAVQAVAQQASSRFAASGRRAAKASGDLLYAVKQNIAFQERRAASRSGTSVPAPVAGAASAPGVAPPGHGTSGGSAQPDPSPGGRFTARGRNGQLTVTPSKIVISRGGVLGFSTHGHAGDKEIDIEQITSIQVKKPGLATVGYIQFAFMGGSEAKHGIKQAVNDENTILFAKKVEDDFLKAKSLIDGYRDDLRQRRQAPVANSLTPVEQLEKLAELHRQGIVTDDEFAAKKKELLAL